MRSGSLVKERSLNSITLFTAENSSATGADAHALLAHAHFVGTICWHNLLPKVREIAHTRNSCSYAKSHQ